MVFTSLKFLIFLAIVIAVYFVCPIKHRWVVLLAGSLTFYAIAGVKYIPFMLAAAFISWYAAILISRENAKLKSETAELSDKAAIKARKEQTKAINKRYVTIAVIVLIAYLAYTKFARMSVAAFESLVGGGTDLADSMTIIVPLGISYYTFSTVGYVLDVYWKRYAAEENFFRYLLYVCYFPHILQGPIARYDRVGKSLREEHAFDYKRFCYGMQLMVWGFFEKLVIADRLSTFVATVFDDCANQYGWVMITAVFFYAIQIYTDFAGCVNIAMGMSEIMGIEIENNFRQPYFSKSVDEFWRRWHMTLGAWFKDYLCMPVSMTRAVKDFSKKMREKHGAQAGKTTTTVCALIAVWICTGAWHGTGWDYMIWAAWQCGIIVIGLVMKDSFTSWKQALHINEDSAAWGAFQIVRTFFLVGIVPRVVTRANSLSDALIIFKHMFSKWDLAVFFDGRILEYGLNNRAFIAAVISILVLLAVSLMHEKEIKIRETIASKNIVIRWIIYILAIVIIVVFGVWGPGYDASTFVYMDF